MANEVERCAADLAWIADAAPLMSASFWSADGYHLAGALPDASERAGELAASLPALGPRPKVGRYFEGLHEVALSTTAGLELLASQLPLRTRERTIGELDCLYRHDGKVTHREIAVKYYLCVEDGPDPALWWGPSKRDRLDLKLERMRTHQLRLSELAGDAWPASLPLPNRREALLLGALFRREEHTHLPDGATPQLELGRWYYASEFDAEGWKELPKPWWLSPHQQRWEPPRPLDLANLRHPVMVGREDSGAPERAFVIPDQWWQDADKSPNSGA
jgi:hypothetical protein